MILCEMDQVWTITIFCAKMLKLQVSAQWFEGRAGGTGQVDMEWPSSVYWDMHLNTYLPGIMDINRNSLDKEL